MLLLTIIRNNIICTGKKKGHFMYVCVCNALTEEQVRKAAADGGSGCARDLYTRMGCEPKCGLCIPVARRIAGEARAGSARMAIAPAE